MQKLPTPTIKVLNLSSTDLAASAFNGYDLHDDLGSRGIETRFGSFWATSSEEDWSFSIHQQKFARPIYETIRNIEKAVGFQNKLQLFGPAFIKSEEFAWADVVHLHIVHDHWLNLSTLTKITQVKPTIWTWHDLWPITGHCIQPTDCTRWRSGCGDCPDLKRPVTTFRDRTAKNLEEKTRWLEQLNCRVHVTTRWMEENVKKFFPSANLNLVRRPFGIEPYARPSAQFKTELRKSWGLSEDGFVVVTREGSSGQKGFEKVFAAMQQISKSFDVSLVVLDSQTTKTANFRIIDIPWTNDRGLVNAILGTSDVFVSASEGESFGMLVLESLIAETPALVLEDVASAEIVANRLLTFAADSNDQSLVNRLTDFIKQRDLLPGLLSEWQSKHQHAFSKDGYVDFLEREYRSLAAKGSDPFIRANRC